MANMATASSILMALLLLTSTSFAHPTHHTPRLEDLQCRCLSLTTDSTKPTLCTYMEAMHRLDFYTASAFASEHNLKLHLASQDTVTKVLEINRPLPTEVLESISEVPEVEGAWVQSEMRIVCGFGGEVERMGREEGDEVDVEGGIVGVVVMGCMMLVGVYVFIAWAWASSLATGNIKLEGDEKTLMADFDNHHSEPSQDQDEAEPDSESFP